MRRIIISAFLFLSTTLVVASEIPRLLNYQGKLENENGEPITGYRTLVFGIYSDSISGTALWTETQTDVLMDSYGLFSVTLGAATLNPQPIPDSIFNNPNLWLGVRVGPDYQEIIPRTRLTSMAFSFRSSHSTQSDTAKVSLSAAPGSVNSLAIIDQSISLGDIGQNGASTGQVMKWNGSGWVAADDSVSGGAANNWNVTDSVLYTNNYWGIARGGAGNVISGSDANTVINLGVSCTTSVAAAYSFIGGGLGNFNDGRQSVIGGGWNNHTGATWATIAGGLRNSATGNYSVISGGTYNTASGQECTIAGGSFNTASLQSATIGGGQGHTSASIATTIGGGRENSITAQYATISGGYLNNIGTGGVNHAQGQFGLVGGGRQNSITEQFSVIAGGQSNTIGGEYSFVGGGRSNYVLADYAGVIGGFADTITSTGDYSFLIGAGSKLTQDSTFMVDLPHIRFGDETSGYEFPTSDGTAGQVLSTNGSAKLGWISQSVGGEDSTWSVVDSVLYTNKYWGIARGGVGNVILGDSAHTVVILGVGCTVGDQFSLGNFYQTIGGGFGNSAVRDHSTVCGGKNNAATGIAGFIGGGNDNVADWNSVVVGGHHNSAGPGSSIVGGSSNTATASASFIGNGQNNSTTAGTINFIGAGAVNTVSGSVSSIVNGWFNDVSGQRSSIVGGAFNSVDGDSAFVGAGANNSASGSNSVVGGGIGNTSSGRLSAIVSGDGNIASGTNSFVGSGISNWCNGMVSTVLGGNNNTNGSNYSSIVGGDNNEIGQGANYALILGGKDNIVWNPATYSLAFGEGVDVLWSYRAAFFSGDKSGRLGVNRDENATEFIDYPIHVGTNSSNGNGAHLTEGGVWTNASSKQFKDRFESLDGTELLEKIRSMSIQAWSYKNSEERHIGPVSEDFVERFDVGDLRLSDGQREDRYLSSIDEAGVALAGVKELAKENKELWERVERLEALVRELLAQKSKLNKE